MLSKVASVTVYTKRLRATHMIQHRDLGSILSPMKRGAARRPDFSLFGTLILLAATALPVPQAAAASRCFAQPGDAAFSDQNGRIKGVSEYLLGIDKLLEPVLVRFFPDGHVCGMNPYLDIRFEGSMPNDGQLQLSFLAAPPLEANERNSTDPSVVQKKYIIALFSRGIAGEARRQQTSDLILWDGQAQDSTGRKLDFYLKRAQPTARLPAPSNNDAVNRCGDGGCDPLKFVVAVKPGTVDTLRTDLKQMPVDKIEQVKGDGCPYVKATKGDICFVGMAWPFEEATVVHALKLKSYVRDARRFGGDAGTDTDSLLIKSDSLLSQNLRINVPVAVPLFQDALRGYFDGSGLSVPDAASRQNSLTWEIKGRRPQFERNAHPSPSEQAEWWKIRLQVAITEGAPGTYVLIVGVPESRTTAWALNSVPTDEKFTTELTNDPRFLDLQGRLIVAITKSVAVAKALP
jgi:hypothetical protein